MAVVRRHHYHTIFIMMSLFLLSFRNSVSQRQQQNPTSSSSRALLKFKTSLTISINSDSLSNWKLDSSPCVWVGIVCNMEADVTSINLASMGLQGRPDVVALSPLQHLESISLQNNSLLGPIPAFTSLPGGLQSIYASQNHFSGVIPPDYFQPLRSTLKTLWLSDNIFSGPIPSSLGDLPYLQELHLENNHFSGPIPGPISNKFNKEAFQNNPHLCGPKASKDCPSPSTVLAQKLVIAAVVVALFLLIISIKDKRKEDKNIMRFLCKENNMNEAAAVVSIPNITRKISSSSSSSSSSRKGYAGLNKTKSTPKRGGPQPVGELVMVSQDKGPVFSSEDLMKASAEVLGNGGLGSAYKATLGNGVTVVLKKLKEMNKMSKDVFEREMRTLGRLKHQNILAPLAYHFRKEDRFLVSEYVTKGSLHNVLHGDREIKNSELSWPNRLKMIKGVARAMGYLHSELASYELPHGNLKSSNVLIGQDYEPLVSDYALHPLINTTPSAQSMFAYRSPEAILHRQVSHKSDVYCLGIIILEMVTGRYPSQYISNNLQKGESGTDVVQWVRSALGENREGDLIDPEMLATGAKDCVGQIKKLLHIGADCTESKDDRRIDMKEAITRIEDV